MLAQFERVCDRRWEIDDQIVFSGDSSWIGEFELELYTVVANRKQIHFFDRTQFAVHLYLNKLMQVSIEDVEALRVRVLIGLILVGPGYYASFSLLVKVETRIAPRGF